METTEEAVPTITSPTTQSRATTTSRTVETASCRPPTRKPAAEARAWRCPSLAVVGRAGVTAAAPPGRGRATLPGPTPDAWRQSLARGCPSGGGSCEFRHREEVAVEDPEAQRAEEPAEDPEPH